MKMTLEAARVNAGLTQAELGKKLNVSKTTIWSWEKGKSLPKLNQFQKFCEVCNVSMESIFLPTN